jgi:hypothetical protein
MAISLRGSRRGPSKVLRAATISLCALSLTGCASISAMQKPVTLADTKEQFVCPTGGQLDSFNAMTGVKRGQYRNKIVFECVKAINRRYDGFKLSLHKESTSAGLVTDLATLGLTTGAAVAGKTAAKWLAAGGALSAGTGATISKDIFYQQTLPALEASMDARRDKVLASILDAESADPLGEKYTLTNAGFDLEAYQGGGNLYAAISELTKTAVNNATNAKAEVDQAKQGLILDVGGEPGTLDPSVQVRLHDLVVKIYQLKETTDDAKLASIAGKLKVAFQPNDQFVDKQARVVAKLNDLSRNGDAASQATAVTNLETDLKPFLGG